MSTVWVTATAEGFHHWPDAPAPLAHLSHPHRHLFHLRAELPVTGLDRELSFEAVRRALLDAWPGTALGPLSCEQIATAIAGRLSVLFSRPCTVTVSEDGEAGATVTTDGPPHSEWKQPDAEPEPTPWP